MTINQFRNGEISEREFREFLEQNPELQIEGYALLNETMCDDELTRISGGGNGQYIVGTEGDDRPFSGGGAPLVGGEGDDTIEGLGGDDRLVGKGGDDALYGGDGNDMISGDNASGGDPNASFGNDYLDGGSGDDWMMGESGNDTLVGGDGNDTLEGGVGNDSLDGGEGDDVLRADQNTLTDATDHNVFTGGEGADTFVFDINSGETRITDFEVGVDSLALNTHFGFTVETVSGGTLIHIDGATIFLEQVRLSQEEVEAHLVDFSEYE